MIYTVTYNPSIDYILRLPALDKGETNRTTAESLRAGGKGVNVALVLKDMGKSVRAAVMTAGFVGEEIERRLTALGLDCDFIRINGNSRINVKIKAEEETEINGMGAPAPSSATDALIARLSALTKGDWLDLSGNTAKGTDDDTYIRIMRSVPSDVRIVVDAHGGLLESTLPLKPFLVKPNLDELQGLFGCHISMDELPRCAQVLRSRGAENAIVSLGADGAVLAAADGTFIATPPKGRLVNSTGAGDSMVAAFIAAIDDGQSVVDAFRYATAAGTACAYSEGLATKQAADALVGEVTVRRV